jgi:hypothetical protein
LQKPGECRVVTTGRTDEWDDGVIGTWSHVDSDQLAVFLFVGGYDDGRLIVQTIQVRQEQRRCRGGSVVIQVYALDFERIVRLYSYAVKRMSGVVGSCDQEVWEVLLDDGVLCISTTVLNRLPWRKETGADDQEGEEDYDPVRSLCDRLTSHLGGWRGHLVSVVVTAILATCMKE